MPKTKLLYLADAYLKDSKAKITKVEKVGDQYAVTLNQTIFYPQGGGQTSDKGTITGLNGSLRVDHVVYHDGTPQHFGKITGNLAKGELITCTLDWDRRYQNMQLHTAGHLLDEAVKAFLPEHLGIDGMHGISHKNYVEFKGFIDTTHQELIQDLINQLISDNLSITSRMVTFQEIEKEGIVLPFELPKNKPLRLIQIGDHAPVPDGGTQLKSTSECWPIVITEFTYTQGNTFIHYTVTPPEKTIIKGHQGDVALDQPGISLKSFHQKLNQLSTTSSKKDLKTLTSDIPKLPVQDRATAGQLLNEFKRNLSKNSSQSSEISHPPSDNWLDVTAPAKLPPMGHLHLITEAIQEIEEIFKSLGFIRRRYPEIESDWYYAEGLNIPKNHPARDDQETFYFSPDVVLTAHTSNGQLREMELVKNPPIKMINIGKTYRRQASNTHSPMFHQFEGLLVDKHINITHLIGVSNYFVRHYFGLNRKIRLRPHHFQFTEPSFEVDINCHLCGGKGEVKGSKCKVCKSGWLELGGAGMVHPVVLKNGGLDPQKYSGFAFGWGVERIIMMKHQVTDNLRQLYTDDLRFLEQA